MELTLKRFNVKEKIYKIIPYLLIFIASIFGNIILFHDGFPFGDDIAFHFSNIYDMYLDLKEGSISPISDLLASGLGFGKNLFYSPLVHLTTCMIAILFEPFGMSLLGALKLNLFLSVFLSGIIMYRFGMHISKNKRIPSLIAAFVFVLYPYRTFDMICRVALAEAYSFLFMPLFFMGLYDFVHIGDRGFSRSISCLEIILGGSLLFLTHNITAIYSYFFGVIYLLFHIKKIYYTLKYDKVLILYALVSMLLLLGIASKTLFSAYSLYSTGFYNVSNETRMWTSASYLANRGDFEWYSGLLNFEYLKNFGWTKEKSILDASYFVIFTIGMTVMDYFLAKINKLKYFHSIIVSTLGIVPMIFLSSRTEILLGVVIFHISYLYFVYSKEYKNLNLKEVLYLSILSSILLIISIISYKTLMYGVVIVLAFIYTIFYSLTKEKRRTSRLHKDTLMDLYYLIFVHALTLLLIVGGNIWYIIPSTLRSIQFPWRLFGFLSLFSSILAVEILKNFNKKYLSIVGLVGASFLLFTGEAIPEKEILYNSEKDKENSLRWIYKIDDSYFTDWASFGACREYFPYMYYFNDTYKSSYSNSLYPKVKKHITNKSFYGKELKEEAIILEGSGSIHTISHKAPIVELELNIESDSTIQIPLIYYPGYKIILEDNHGNVKVLDAEEIDGLVSIHIESGEYNLKTIYEGTTIMKLGNIYQAIAIPLTFLMLTSGILLDNKKRIKEENALYK